ncbi:Mitochondrial thiamine diphosphate carrier 1 [Phytophthora citrophthora]|uniref:Mitochondrial thiamine diphosphate carrier 1 n=1 Tax=Phytophthora citrophthora TaxID=4793 RepID=A0AAD9GXB3_9STRA|nr:Mitochondrial thiamine diphosphate carrier 1 [Phytophthora citrophthora]
MCIPTIIHQRQNQAESEMTSAGSETEAKRGASTTEAAFAGAVSGGVTRLVAAPLDLLKIRFQVQPTPVAGGHAEAKYANILQAVRSIYAEEGLRSFWRGNLAASGLWVGYSALQFASYRALTRFWERNGDISALGVPGALVSAANGATAGVTATIVTYPLDFFRTAFASQGMPKKFPTMRSLMVHTWETQGVRGFYSGLGGAIFQIVPYMGLSFGIYSTLNGMSEKYRNTQKEGDAGAWMPLATALSYVGSGAVAGLVSKLAVYPLDTVKKRMQMRHVPRCATYGVIPMYSSSWSCFVDVLQREGVRGLYKGTVPSLLKSVVAASSTFATYELTLEVLRHISIRGGHEKVAEVKALDRA